MSEATATRREPNTHFFTHLSLPPWFLLLPHLCLFLFYPLLLVFYLFSHVNSTLHSLFSDLFTSIQRAAWLRHCFPMLPLSISPCPEAGLLSLVPVGSVHCNSAVSYKQTSLIGHCYSQMWQGWKNVPELSLHFTGVFGGKYLVIYTVACMLCFSTNCQEGNWSNNYNQM